MKAKEIKATDKNTLNEKVLELKKELLKVNAQVAIGTALKNPGQVKKIKKPQTRILRNNRKKEAEKIKKRNGFSMPCFCGGKYNFKIKAATKNHTATKKHQKYLKLHHEAIKKGLINNKQVKE